MEHEPISSPRSAVESVPGRMAKDETGRPRDLGVAAQVRVPRTLTQRNRAGDPPFLGEHGYIRDRISDLVSRVWEAVHPQRFPVEDLRVAGPMGRVPFREAVRQSYRAAAIGEQLGPAFATYWFRLQAEPRAEWAGSPVDLHWLSNSEACVWRDGQPFHGLNPGRDYVRLTNAAPAGEAIDLYVEVACNHLLGVNNEPGQPFPADANRSPHWLERCDLCLFDPDAWDLYHDLRVLAELEADSTPAQESRAIGNHTRAVGRPPLENAWAGRLLYDLNQVGNVLDPSDRETWPEARKILAGLLATRNGGSTHQLSGIGHAHIDTAWLWPIQETYRKTVRTFCSALATMERYPEFQFAVSQAYQYEQIEERDPDLFERIQDRVKAGQWRPVGGTYIEPDCNLPSGESLVRQFVYGQRYFESRFGRRCKEFWNPDVFGYNGQLPQIMRQVGVECFLTQKLSWNRFSTPPHHTFFWRGIDGSEVLTHFPPADTYNGTGSVEELRYHAANYKDADRGVDGLYLFGHGDGGGGPTPQMLETLRRTEDLQGVPQSRIREPEEFFKLLSSRTRSIPAIDGELYFELHRGTYTSQAEMKRGLRDGERLLHDIEFLAVLNGVWGNGEYPKERIDAVWKRLLLNQFHDILPGSSIAEVHRTAEQDFEWIRAEGASVRTQLKEALTKQAASAGLRPLNTTGFARTCVSELPDGDLVAVDVPQYGFGEFTAARLEDDAGGVVLETVGDDIVLKNAHLEACFSPSGELKQLVHAQSGRAALSQPGNLLQLHDDHPSQWDAWDVEPSILETGRACVPAASYRVRDRGPLRAELEFDREIGRGSRLRQSVRLDAHSRRLEFHCHVEWREDHKLLRVEFPLDVQTDRAAFETAFGTVQRPTSMNNAAEKAQFETPGHRWADLSEPGFGVGLLTDYKHGFSSHGNVLGLSLLRSPTYPDPACDRGEHRFAYALYPHAGDWRTGDVLREAVAFNNPILWSAPPDKMPSGSICSVADSTLVCDTVKPAENGRGVILRLYEPYGTSGVATLRTSIPVTALHLCNALEDDLKEISLSAKLDEPDVAEIQLDHGPFQIVTLRFVP